MRPRVPIEYLHYLLVSTSRYSFAGSTIDGMGILLILKILKGTRSVDVGGSDSVVEGHDVCLRDELPALRFCYTTLFVHQFIENSDKICFGGREIPYSIPFCMLRVATYDFNHLVSVLMSVMVTSFRFGCQFNTGSRNLRSTCAAFLYSLYLMSVTRWYYDPVSRPHLVKQCLMLNSDSCFPSLPRPTHHCCFRLPWQVMSEGSQSFEESVQNVQSVNFSYAFPSRSQTMFFRRATTFHCPQGDC